MLYFLLRVLFDSVCVEISHFGKEICVGEDLEVIRGSYLFYCVPVGLFLEQYRDTFKCEKDKCLRVFV